MTQDQEYAREFRRQADALWVLAAETAISDPEYSQRMKRQADALHERARKLSEWAFK